MQEGWTSSIQLATDGPLNLRSEFHRVVVFPASQHKPPTLSEDAISLTVTLHISSDLRDPEFRVRLRRREMLGTSMPEATVHEDCDLRGNEDHVRSPREPLNGPTRQSVAK